MAIDDRAIPMLRQRRLHVAYHSVGRHKVIFAAAAAATAIVCQAEELPLQGSSGGSSGSRSQPPIDSLPSISGESQDHSAAAAERGAQGLREPINEMDSSLDDGSVVVLPQDSKPEPLRRLKTTPVKPDRPIWEYNAQYHVEQICYDCACLSIGEQECRNGGTAAHPYCYWNLEAAECRLQVSRVTFPPVMTQCFPTGGDCVKCSDVRSEAQCGYAWLENQASNCTWDNTALYCVDNKEEVDRWQSLLELAPAYDHNRQMQDFKKNCEDVEEKNDCGVDGKKPECDWFVDREDDDESYCHPKINSQDYRSFYSRLGYTKDWVNRSRNCSKYHDYTQSQCLKIGCDWLSEECGISLTSQCQLQCNITVPDRMPYAYVKELNQQCGEPCDETESTLKIGEPAEGTTDELPYDVTTRAYAEKLCGEKCNTDPKCAGFNVVESLNRCYYRKSTTCFIRRNNDRDCYTKKGKCNSLQCPPGFLPWPGEEDTFCAGLQCTIASDRDRCCQKAICIDTPDWRSGEGCREEGFSLSQGCTPRGWTCEAYDIWYWCRPSNINRGVPIPGAEWALGEAYNFPENHCCICGGGDEVLDTLQLDRPTPPPLHALTLNPPAQHLCCLGMGEGLDQVAASLPEHLNHTALDRVMCATDDYLANTKRGAACMYCRCLHEDGLDLLREPQCCSLRQFGAATTDAQTGFPMCTSYTVNYKLNTSGLRACELRYDLYPFAPLGAAGTEVGPRQAVWCVAVFGVVMALIAQSSEGEAR
eukprot:TRINITY_DN82714_c0_g1_i1.p1 TRINITY_DN82714_c0_g1~~TRINITY_DN82714_c0_g1_i1.p1  ORF type:complete len:759 (+),score=151.30 TRINITY_DN82714_c0_g1_i1:70-2346(+)